MLKNLKQSIEAAKQERADRAAERLSEFLDRLDDPIALGTEWSPASVGGTSFRTHRLAEISPLRLELKPTFGAMCFCWLFIALGVLPVAAAVGAMTGVISNGPPLWLMLPIGAIFAGVGFGMFWAFSRPRVFDMQDLWYWRGKRPKSREAVDACSKSAPLDRVHAIQILHEECRGDKTTYSSYEINLVLHDGTRVNVIDHGNLEHIRKDARKLADLIGVPVWDASELRDS